MQCAALRQQLSPRCAVDRAVDATPAEEPAPAEKPVPAEDAAPAEEPAPAEDQMSNGKADQ